MKIPKVQNSNNRIDMEYLSEFGSGRVVNSVSGLLFGDIKSSIMKSSEYSNIDISDSLAYVFNFNDSLGYAIIISKISN